MRLFFYKTLIIFFFIVLVYKLTISKTIMQIEASLDNLSSKENISTIKEKLRDEIKSSLSKKKILKSEDATLIKKFIDKISNEIREAN